MKGATMLAALHDLGVLPSFSRPRVSAPMEQVFRSLKAEWIPASGFRTAQEARYSISDFLMHRYSWIRPHQFNGGLAPARAEEKLNTVFGIG